MHFTTRSFLGHTDPNSWSQFWENEPDDVQVTSSRGHLFGLVNLSLLEDEDASALGHNLINELNTHYFSPSDTPLKTWLVESVDTIAANFLPSCSHLTLLVVVYFENQLYLVSYNSGQMIFQRGSQISTILKSLSSKTSVIVGKSQDGDQLLLTTYPFSQGYTWDKIKNYLSLGKTQDIEESFLSELYTLPDQSHLAGALIQFNQDDLPIVEDPSPHISSPTPQIPTTPSPHIPQTNPYSQVISKIFPPRSNYVPHLEPANLSRRRHLNIIFSILVLVALGASIFISSQRNIKNQTESKYQTLRSEFNSKIKAANAVKNINLADAQKLALEADTIISKMSALKIHSDEILKLQTSTKIFLSETGSAKDYTPQKYFDTTLILPDSKFSQMYLYKNNLYLLDGTSGRIDKIDITNKSKQNIATIDGLKGVLNFAVDNDVVFVQKDKQIYQLSSSNIVSKINLPSAGQINFWNGSLYLLNDSIWKFTPNSTGFDKGAVWLKSGQTLPSNPVSLAINGQIWVISLTGEIQPYTHGAKTEFKIKTNTVFTKAANLVTALDSEIIAFTDNDNIIYVYKKTGESLSNFNYGTKNILSLAYDQGTNTIFVLCSDAQIYQIKL